MARARMRGKLGDWPNDAGIVMPGGRQQQWWHGKIDLVPSRIGVERIRSAEWLRDPDAACEEFRLMSIEFGNWMTADDRAHALYGAMQSLADLATILRADHNEMGLNGRLSIALGARGRGAPMAHYEPSMKVINLTKRRGRGCVAHEYGHALDHYCGVFDGIKWASGGDATTTTITRKLLGGDTMRSYFEHLFQSLYYEKNGEPTEFLTAFAKCTQRADYWTSRSEVFALVFEAWIWYRSQRLGIRNLYLCDRMKVGGLSFKYPSQARIESIDKSMSAIMRECFDRLQREEEPDSIETTKSATTTLQTPEGPISARYAVIEASHLVTSHNPLSWSANRKYPVKCQQRDYSRDKAEQRKVEQGAANLAPSFLLSDTPTAVDGPPIVTPHDGKNIVLGGSGRGMMILLAPEERYRAYRTEMMHVAERFGLDLARITRMRKPVLVRVIDIDMQQCAYWSNALNRGLTQGIDLTTETFAIARQIPPGALDLIAELIEEAEAETMADVFNNPRASRILVGILRKAKIIDDTNVSQYLSRSGDIDEQGRFRIQSMLLGALLKDARIAGLARNYTAHILRTAPGLLRAQSMGGQWDLMPLLTSAIELEHERRSAGIPKQQFLTQTNMMRGDIPENVRTVWQALDSGPKRFAQFVNDYLTRASTEAQGSGLGFHEPLDRDSILRGAGHGVARQPVTIDDILRRPVHSLAFSKPFSDFFGDEVAEPFSLFIWGQKFNGKSSFTIHLADELGMSGPVLLNSAEEKETATSLQRRLQHINRPLDNVNLVSIASWPTFVETLEQGHFRFVIIDSIQKMARHTSEQTMLDYFDANRDRWSWIFVGRSQKDAKFAAGKVDWGFECDIEVKLENMIATFEKNRFVDPRTLKRRRYYVMT